MKSVSISETKNRLSALLDEVKAGETVVITDRGTPVARIERIPPAEDGDARLARLERAGIIRRGKGNAREILNRPLAKLKPGHEWAAVDAIIEERRTGR